jgi:chloramphenicol 3-O phosphotransferase
VYFSTALDGAIAVNLGPGGQAMARAFHRTVAVLASSGFTVLVDDVLFERWLLIDWLEALADHRVCFVGVRCDLVEAERREIARGDRQPGQVRSHFHEVHAHGDYDIAVDTTHTDPRICAQELLQKLDGLAEMTAFDRLRARAAQLR